MRLNREQLEALQDRILPMLGYFSRLERRMEVKGFGPDDRLLQMVRSAHDDLHRLSVELHYRSCDGNVGR